MRRALIPLDPRDKLASCGVQIYSASLPRPCRNRAVGRLSPELHAGLIRAGANLDPDNRNLCELHAEAIGQFIWNTPIPKSDPSGES